MVLDQFGLEHTPHLLILPAHLGMHGSIRRHLLCCRLPCVPPAKPTAQPVTEQSGKERRGSYLRVP